KDLVETLRRNLQPEIRHELLNVSIYSVQKLRDISRHREGFLEDVKRTYGYQKPVPFRKQVSELVQEYLSDDAAEFSDAEQVAEVDALALVCWNCRKEGHRYHEFGMPCAEVQILGRLVLGLLDTGASMSAVGGNLANQIIKQGMAFKRVATTVNTADGQQQKVVGRLKTPIQYEGKIHELDLYIIPSLSQDLCKDRRPYTTVVILNRRIKGLMDTGASMRCVGGQFAQEILASDVPIKRVFNNISTADGSKQSIVGSIRSNIEYNGVI
ncbi:hypothetical protein KR200_003632, partial [Drosophila serrata]